MSDETKEKKPVKISRKMDPRCPRALKNHPGEWCPLAVMRLKAIRNAGRELTEEEESKLPGCPWSINHQLANYCFFKYMAEYGDGAAPSDNEIAALNCISIETVKKVEKTAITKMKQVKEFKEIKAGLAEGESVLTPHASDEDNSIYT